LKLQKEQFWDFEVALCSEWKKKDLSVDSRVRSPCYRTDLNADSVDFNAFSDHFSGGMYIGCRVEAHRRAIGIEAYVRVEIERP
jgi:hypothetical protein